MRVLLFASIAALTASGAFAQGATSLASPIPEGAEKRFCYYEGLAYSENAFILLSGNNTVTNTINTREERLQRCVRDEDGWMSWRPESNMQLSR